MHAHSFKVCNKEVNDWEGVVQDRLKWHRITRQWIVVNETTVSRVPKRVAETAAASQKQTSSTSFPPTPEMSRQWSRWLDSTVTWGPASLRLHRRNRITLLSLYLVIIASITSHPFTNKCTNMQLRNKMLSSSGCEIVITLKCLLVHDYLRNVACHHNMHSS